MLFACLQGEGKTLASVAIDRAADKAPGHLPHQGLLATHVTEIRATRHHRHTQRLPLATSDIGTLFAPLPRRFQQGHGNRIGDADDQCAIGVCPVG